MKIALVQPFWSDQEDPQYPNDSWDKEALIRHLHGISEDVDLVVFPECYPWCGDEDGQPSEGMTLDFMREQMAEVSRNTKKTFIAGGLVREGNDTRNVVMLASPGSKCSDEHVYRKRLPWEDENITPGEIEQDALFKFGSDQQYAVIPLICADVFGAATRETPQQHEDHQAIVDRARDRMRCRPGAPIIVCAYAAGPRGRRWNQRLDELVTPFQDQKEQTLDALFCNFAGHHTIQRNIFGRGGSRLVSSRDTSRRGPRNPGVFIYDLGPEVPTAVLKRNQSFP